MASFSSEYKDPFLYYTHYLALDQDNSDIGPDINIANIIVYCIDGKCTMLSEGAKYEMEPGNLFITKSLECLLIHPTEFPCRLHYISFSPYYFYIMDPEMRLNRIISDRTMGVGNMFGPDDMDTQLIKGYFDIIPNYKDPYSRRLAVTNALLNTLVQLLSVRRETPRDTRPEELIRIFNYLDKNVYNTINAQEAADQLYISRPQLDRLVKKATGFSLWNFLIHKRVNKAIQLLQNGVSTHDAAVLTGFKDYSTFYKEYVKIVGKPPISDRPGRDSDPFLHNFYPV